MLLFAYTNPMKIVLKVYRNDVEVASEEMSLSDEILRYARQRQVDMEHGFSKLIEPAVKKTCIQYDEEKT